MPNKSENPEIKSIVIEKIVKKIKEIFDLIKNQTTSECLQQIEDWLKQIKPEALTNDISHFSGMLDIIFFYLHAEFSKEKKAQIEYYLGIVLNNFNQLQPKKIVILITSLNKYIHADDVAELERLNSELTPFTNKFSLELKLRKKIKPRIIDFDNEGKGFVVEKTRKLVKEICTNETVNQTNPDINLNQMHYKIFSCYENESQLSKDIREAVLLRSFLSKEKIGIKYERSIEIIFQSIELEEFKEIIRKRIYEFKTQDPNIILSEYKKPKTFQLPKFLDIQNKYLDNFLLLINFSNLEKLIKEVQIISDNIYTLMPVLDDIKNFYCEWGINYDLFKNFYVEVENFNRTFNQKFISNYVEMMMRLIEEKKLKLDENNLDEFYQISDICLKKLSENSLIEEINSLKLTLSIENFLNNQKKEIKNYFDKQFHARLDVYSNKLTNISLFKSFLIKMKELILNFFSVSFFINNINNLGLLAPKFDISNLNNFFFERIHNEFNLKIKWWHFLGYRMNPLFLLSLSFKKNLSEQLFLYIVNYKFTQIIEFFEFSTANRMSTDTKKNIECVDTLFLIQSILEKAEIGNTKGLTNFYGNKTNISSPKSRKQVIELLEKAETFIALSKMISTLNQNIRSVAQKLSKLFNITLENMKKLEENQEKDNLLLSHVTNGKCIFQLSKNTRVEEDIASNTITLKA
ncbi:hypothetical protein [Rickettsiella endosymbiont of Miltochrista miniata]|uniref:hypothetical protein n=1 Tax=Rickettsiella endosymbiont of Miltochrista miniata TaxID=3066239 RepID=UPI00313CD558